MIRATTPTHQFCFGEGIDSESFSKVLITYTQNGTTILEKDEGDLDWIVPTPSTGAIACVTLTQSETKLFSALYDVEIQLRALTTEGDALASPIIKRKVFDVLNDEVLTDA